MEKDDFIVLILAAGLGSRMGDLTRSRAKPSLSIGSTTILGRLLAQLYSFKSIAPFSLYVNCSHMASSIVEVIRDEGLTKFVNLFWEERPLGSALTYWKLSESLMKPFIVIHGDQVWPTTELRAVITRMFDLKANASIAIHRRSGNRARSRVQIDRNRLVSSYEEAPESVDSSKIWVNSGMYMLPWNVRERLAVPRIGESLTEFVIPRLVELKSLTYIVNSGKRISVETPLDLHRAKYKLRRAQGFD